MQQHIILACCLIFTLPVFGYTQSEHDVVRHYKSTVMPKAGLRALTKRIQQNPDHIASANALSLSMPAVRRIVATQGLQSYITFLKTYHTSIETIPDAHLGYFGHAIQAVKQSIESQEEKDEIEKTYELENRWWNKAKHGLQEMRQQPSEADVQQLAGEKIGKEQKFVAISPKPSADDLLQEELHQTIKKEKVALYETLPHDAVEADGSFNADAQRKFNACIKALQSTIYVPQGRGSGNISKGQLCEMLAFQQRVVHERTVAHYIHSCIENDQEIKDGNFDNFCQLIDQVKDLDPCREDKDRCLFNEEQIGTMRIHHAWGNAAKHWSRERVQQSIAQQRISAAPIRARGRRR